MKEDLRDIKRAIPRDLWRQARADAILDRKTVAKWIAEAIEEKLERKKRHDYSSLCR